MNKHKTFAKFKAKEQRTFNAYLKMVKQLSWNNFKFEANLAKTRFSGKSPLGTCQMFGQGALWDFQHAPLCPDNRLILNV